MKVKDLIQKLQSYPQDYEVTYIDSSIGHITLSENQVSYFDNTKEVIIQTQTNQVKGE